MLGAGAAAADTLVKNLGQTTSAAVANLSNRDLSQAFTTGSTADAYELTEVKVQFGTVPGSTATVTAFIADGQGTSDDIIANLTNPPTWTTTSTFTAPDGITLDANTTYHLIIEGTEGTLATTASDSEDSGGVTGWSIADGQTQRSMVSDSGLGGTWTIAINALKISVDGDHKGTVTACSVASMQNQIWTAILTVGTARIFNIAVYGWNAPGQYTGGNLTDEDFNFDSESYGIAQIRTGGGISLGFTETGTGDIATQATRNRLILHVGNDSFKLGEGLFDSNRTINWASNPPAWAKYDRVCLALTEVDTTPPAVSEAVLATDSVILLGYDETLDSASVPDKSQFEVKVEGTVRTIISAGVSPDNSGIRLTLSSAVRPGETVTVSYTVPSMNPIRDEADNPAAAFTDQTVTNTLASTAPEAPGNLAATPGTVADTMVLTWDTPWANGRDITKFQAHHVAGSTAGGTWADILNSDADTTTHTVTGLTAGTQYTFEVRAVNGIGNGAAATVTQTTATPTWELTLTDNGNAVTELVEGGASATATVRITNGVTFGTAQTVTLEWDESPLDAASPIQGSGGASEITIPPGTSSGTLVISAPDPGGVAAYDLPRTAPLWGRHGENQISGIDLTFSDDEEPPVATLTAQPAQVSEGEAIEVEIRLSLAYGDNATSTLQLIVTDADGALVAPLPTEAQFDAGELTHAITLTAADNAVHNDGAREVTVALAPNPDAALYTLGEPSSATVVVTDNDNVAPVFSDGASATRSVAENTAAGENVGAALTATDTDAGDTLTYTLEGTDAASFDIVSTSGQIRTRSGVTYDQARPSRATPSPSRPTTATPAPPPSR